MSKKIIFPLMLLAALLVVWALYTQNGNQKNHSLFYGNVDYRTITLGFRVPGRLQEVRFEEGEQVKEGELLASLDPLPYEELIRAGEAEIRAQEALVRQLESGFQKEEIALAKAQVEESRAQDERNRKNYDREKPLFESGAISAMQFDATRAAYESSRARLANAMAALELKQKGYRKEEIDRAKASLSALESRLKKQQIDRDDTRLKSPTDGILLVRIREPGAVIGYGEPVIEMAQNDRYWVHAYMEEPDLGRITEGMAAEVYTDSRPDRPYHGKVTFISPQAEFTPKSVQTPRLRTDLVYRFRITLSDPDEGIRQGMPVTVRLPELP